MIGRRTACRSDGAAVRWRSEEEPLAPFSRLAPFLLPLLALALSAAQPRGVRAQRPPASYNPEPLATGPQEREYYANVKSVVNWSPSELFKALPELKSLAPAESQEELATILQKVGENVKAYFRDFPNTTSVEDIRQERFTSSPDLPRPVFESREQMFNYLMLAGPGNRPTVGLEEYRTDTAGNIAEQRAQLEKGSLITKRFASTPIYFHPMHQYGSTFRYLGRQRVDKQETYVVGFAQRPETTRLDAWVNIGTKPVRVLLQGVAWIDPTTYQIIRMRTDLLAPRPDVDLQRETTEIRFAEVHFKALPAGYWLPRDVYVTVNISGQTYRNVHRYSHFKLFQVETQEKVASPK